MKNLYCYMCIFLFITYKSSNEQVLKNDLEKLGLHGSIKNISLKRYLLGEHLTKEEAGAGLQKIEFNRNGYITKVVTNNGISPQTVLDFDYDDLNRKKSGKISENGDIVITFSYKYPDKTNIECHIIYNKTNYSELIRYDLAGNIVEDKYEGKDYIHEKFKYDKDKHCIEKISLNKNGNVIDSSTFSPHDWEYSELPNNDPISLANVNFDAYQKYEKQGKCNGVKMENQKEPLYEHDEIDKSGQIKVIKKCDLKLNWTIFRYVGNSGHDKILIEREISYYD